MKNVKKVLAGLLVFSMMASLAGCKKEIPTEDINNSSVGEESAVNESSTPEPLTPEAGAELIFWTPDVEFGKAAAEGFQAAKGIKVTVEEVGLDGMNKIMLDGPSGKGGDIFMAAHDTFTLGHTAGVFQEINKIIADNVKSQVSEKAYNTAARDGKLYGVPVSIETSVMLYNKAIVTEKPAETLEQIFEEAKTFNDPSKNKYRFLSVPTMGYGGYAVLGTAGFQLFGADGNNNDNPGFDTPEFVKGLELIAKMKEMLPIKSDDLKNGQFLDQCFIDGNAAYYANGPWAVKPLKEAGVDLGATTLPSYKGNPMTPFAGVQIAHVSAYSKYPLAAQMFAEYLVSEEAATLLYDRAVKITSRDDISTVKGLSTDEISKVFVEQFKTATPMPGVKRMGYYWTLSEATLASVFDGTATPADAAKKAKADFDALVLSE